MTQKDPEGGKGRHRSEYRFDDPQTLRYLTMVGWGALAVGVALSVAGVYLVGLLLEYRTFHNTPAVVTIVALGVGTALVGAFLLALRRNWGLVAVAKRVVYGWCVAMAGCGVILCAMTGSSPVQILCCAGAVAYLFHRYVEYGRVR